MLLTDAQHKDLVSEISAKSEKIRTIVAKANEMTQADLIEARQAKDEIAVAKAKIEKHNEAAAIKNSLDDTAKFLREPVRTLPIPDGGSFTTSAGETHIEHRRDGSVGVHSLGEGAIDDTTWRAINDPLYLKAFGKYVRHGKHALSNAELKLMETGQDPQGGYTAPADQLARIVQRQPTPTRVAGMVQNYLTSREFVEMMKVNYSTDNVYTTGFRVTKTGEVPQSVSAARVADSNLFGVITIPVHTFMMTGILTNNQIEDSALNILGWATEKFQQTVDILWDDKIVNGSGRSEASGILLAPGTTDQPDIVGTGTSSTPFLTADALLDLNLSVPEQYDANCKYLMNKTGTYKTVRKLKDSNNRYLLGNGLGDSGLATGNLKELDGYPIVWSGLMPDPAANAYPIVFGDFQGYQLVNRVGFSIQVLRELYAELNQVAIVGRIRFGGQVVEPWRLKVQKCA